MPVEAALISYETKREWFDSRSERNRFYRGLSGYRRTVRRNDKVYRYEKPGLLGETPHIKVADAAFIVHRDNVQKVTRYFDEWSGRVEFEVFRIVLEDHEEQLVSDDASNEQRER